MALCAAVSLCICTLSGGMGELSISLKALPILLLSGIANGVSPILWLLAVRGSAYLLLDTVGTFCITIPVFLSALFFNETVRMNQLVGFVILLAAVITMSSYSSGIKGKLTRSGLLIILGNGLASGMSDFSQRLYVHLIPDGSASAFQFYTFLTASVVFVIFYLSFETRRGVLSQPAGKLIASNIGYVAVMAVCLFLNSFFRLKASGCLSSMEMYPLNQGSTLVLSALMAAVCFKERPNTRSMAGMILTAVGLTVINILNF